MTDWPLGPFTPSVACAHRRHGLDAANALELILYFHYYGSIEYKLSVLQNMEMNTKNALSALAALAQDSRLAVFRLLVQAGPSGIAASKIAEELSIPPSSLSFHLKELTHADLVIPQQDGRFVIYAANYETMNKLMAFMTENCCGGNPCTPMTSCAPRRKTAKAEEH